MDNYYNPYGQGYAVPNYSLQPNAYPQQRFPQQQFQPQPFQQQVKQTNIEYVNGVAGAKGSPLPPNTTKFLLDSEGAFFYIKSTDMEGRPLLKRFRFEEVDENGVVLQPVQQPTIEYATVDEVKQELARLEQMFKSEIDKIKQVKSTSSEVKKQ